MSAILTYPVIVTIGSVILGWILSKIRSADIRFQKYVLYELKHELKLVEANIYPIELYADRLETLGEFVIMGEETQGLISQILKATAR